MRGVAALGTDVKGSITNICYIGGDGRNKVAQSLVEKYSVHAAYSNPKNRYNPAELCSSDSITTFPKTVSW